MSTFDELTLGEVEEIESVVLKGKSFSDDAANPLMIAGGVMWVMQRRDNPALTWDTFKSATTMGAIRLYSEDIQRQEQAVDPTYAPSS
jgi:hypothetical protein